MAMAILVFHGTSIITHASTLMGGIVGALWECEPFRYQQFYRAFVQFRPTLRAPPKSARMSTTNAQHDIWWFKLPKQVATQQGPCSINHRGYHCQKSGWAAVCEMGRSGLNSTHDEEFDWRKKRPCTMTLPVARLIRASKQHP